MNKLTEEWDMESFTIIGRGEVPPFIWRATMLEQMNSLEVALNKAYSRNKERYRHISIAEWIAECKEKELDISRLLNACGFKDLATDKGTDFLKKNAIPCPMGH